MLFGFDPRKMKNAIVMLEWMPSTKSYETLDESIHSGTAQYDAARKVGEALWATFSHDGRLRPAALSHILNEVMQTPVSDDTLADILQGDREGLTSADALVDVLTGSRFRMSRAGRQFMIISLREAETLRASAGADEPP